MLAECYVADKDATKQEEYERKEITIMIIQMGSQEGVSKVRPNIRTDEM
jgi:hypothetical protein